MRQKPVITKPDAETADDPVAGFRTLGGDVLAQGRDLDVAAVQDGGHGAVIDPRRDSLDPCGFQPLDDLFGPQPGCQVHVADRQVKQFVPDRAADVPAGAVVPRDRMMS